MRCTTPSAMLRFLGRKISDRKLRLYACAGCRRIWHMLPDQRSRRAVEVSERFADGLASQQELRTAAVMAREVVHALPESRLGWKAAQAAAAAAADAAGDGAYRAAAAAADADMLREVVGNYFSKATVETAWLSWKQGAVASLAKAIYEDRDTAAFPILADALEE